MAAIAVANRLDERSIAAGVVHTSRIPDLANLIRSEEFGEQLNVVTVRVTQDKVVDDRDAWRNGFDEGQHPIHL
jgi:hypothetical protein